MQFIKSFFYGIDSRILDIDFSNLTDFKYLLETDLGTSYYQDWFVLLSLFGIIFGLILYWYTKRPRERLEKNKRFALKRFSRAHVILSIIWLSLTFFRGQGLDYLNMRIWLVLLLLVMVGNIARLIAKIYIKKKAAESKAKTTSDDYSKYLPKKKKKK